MSKDLRLINKFNIIIGVFSLIASCIVLKYTPVGSGYDFYFVVPGIFGFIIMFCPYISFNDIRNIGPLVLNYTMLIKYVMLPLVACLGNYYSWLGVSPSNEDIRSAVLYTVYEMVFICIESNMLSHYYNKRKNKYVNEVKPLRGRFFHYIFIVLGILTVIVLPATVADQRFLFDQSDLATTIKVDFPLSGIFKTLVVFARYSVVILIINYFYKRNRKKDSFTNVFGAFVPVVINSLYISNLSRIVIFVPIITFSILIFILFDSPKARKAIISLLSIVGFIFIVYLSFVKFFGEGRGNEGNSGSIMWWGDTLNMYFSGVKETAIGIKARGLIAEEYGFMRFNLLFNDVISNVIGLSNFSNPMLTSTRLYNYVYFGSSIAVCQIVPNITEGIYYFGGIFSVLWPGLFVYLCYKFIHICDKQNYLDSKFAYLYASIYCGMVLMINSSMIISNITNVSILFAMIAFLSKKIKIIFKIF